MPLDIEKKITINVWVDATTQLLADPSGSKLEGGVDGEEAYGGVDGNIPFAGECNTVSKSRKVLAQCHVSEIVFQIFYTIKEHISTTQVDK